MKYTVAVSERLVYELAVIAIFLSPYSKRNMLEISVNTFLGTSLLCSKFGSAMLQWIDGQLFSFIQ